MVYVEVPDLAVFDDQPVAVQHGIPAGADHRVAGAVRRAFAGKAQAFQLQAGAVPDLEQRGPFETDRRPGIVIGGFQGQGGVEGQRAGHPVVAGFQLDDVACPRGRDGFFEFALGGANARGSAASEDLAFVRFGVPAHARLVAVEHGQVGAGAHTGQVRVGRPQQARGQFHKFQRPHFEAPGHGRFDDRVAHVALEGDAGNVVVHRDDLDAVAVV